MKSVGMNPSEQVGSDSAIEDKIRLLLHFNLTRSWWTWPTRWRRKEWYISRSCLAQLAVLSSSFSSYPPIPTSPSPPPPSPLLLLTQFPPPFFPYKISLSPYISSFSNIPFVLLYTDIYVSTVCMIPNVRLAKKSGGQGLWLHLGGSWSSFLFKILRAKGFILSLC